jgi:hypothetical protein
MPFLVGLTAAHVIRSSGLSFVTLFREVTTQTCVSAANFVPMRPEIIIGRGVETALPTIFNSFLLDQCLELPQLV